jgi:hypothetical protein
MSIVDLKTDLESLFKGFSWDFVGILDDDGQLTDIPKNSTCISAIIEQKALAILISHATSKYRCEVILPKSTREYPDSTLTGGIFGNSLIAVDIKTARNTPNDRISGLTIGSYAGYFVHPTEKKAGCCRPYGDFAEHWIVAFLYDWDDEKSSRDMVSNIECIVGLKCQMASKSTGTGTTKHIGSVKSKQRLRDGNGEFSTEDEFLAYWRKKGLALSGDDPEVD